MVLEVFWGLLLFHIHTKTLPELRITSSFSLLKAACKKRTPPSLFLRSPFFFGGVFFPLHSWALMLFLWGHRPQNLIKTSLPRKYTHSMCSFRIFMEPLKPNLGSQLNNLVPSDHFNSWAESGKQHPEPNPAQGPFVHKLLLEHNHAYLLICGQWPFSCLEGRVE